MRRNWTSGSRNIHFEYQHGCDKDVYQHELKSVQKKSVGTTLVNAKTRESLN